MEVDEVEGTEERVAEEQPEVARWTTKACSKAMWRERRDV